MSTYGDDVPADDPQQRRAEAYAGFCLRVYSLVRDIPAGYVCTYGRIARAISCPETMDPLAYQRIRARWVGYALAKCPQEIPWWRVVNAQGRISSRPGHGPHVQVVYLREEGVEVNDAGQVLLEQHLWAPPSQRPQGR